MGRNTGEWIELIRVLGPLPDSHPVQQEMESRLEETARAAGLKRALLMTKPSYGSDFAVVMVWEREGEPARTREGLALAEYLRQFGSVDHTAWQVQYAAPAAGGVAQRK